MIGERMTIQAQHALPGDFTTHTGYRAAIQVRPTTGRRTRFTRADGSTDAIPRDQRITVYRHPSPAIGVAPTARPFDPTTTQLGG